MPSNISAGVQPASTMQANKKKKALNFAIPQSFVTIIVDKEVSKQTFVVHKCLVSRWSSFFKTAFNSTFIEGESQSMVIEDIEAPAFGLLVHWLYTRKLKKGEGEDDPGLLLLAKVWALAERFIMPRLQNFVLDQFRSGLDHLEEITILQSLASFAYGKDLAKNNPIRKLTIEKFAYGSTRCVTWPGNPVDYPAEFFTDVMKVLAAFHDHQQARLHGKLSKASEFYVQVREEED